MLAALLAAAAAGASPAPDAGTLAAEAARLLAAQRAGITGFSLAYRYTERQPLRTTDWSARAFVLRQGSSIVTIRVAGTAPGKPTFVEDDYKLPIEAATIAQYRFAAGTRACTSCGGAAIAIDFTSLVRDDEHGDGTMWIDAASHRVLAMQFHPSVLPPRADSGQIDVTFAQVLPDLWDVSSVTQHYAGHLMMFHGWGHVEQRQTDYRRFASLADGLNAANAIAPETSTAAP